MSEHEPARDVNPVTRVSSIDRSESPTLEPDATFDSSELASAASSAGSGASHTTTEPRSMGPYRLIRKIGEGGMGQVWLAEQTAPVRRQVALKLIKVGRFHDEVLQRTEALSFLRQAIDHGLSPTGALGMEKDDDLKSLHGDSRFVALVAYTKERAKSQIVRASG